MLMSKLFFDTDCLSAFLWVGEEPILPKLYPGLIVVPAEVRQEISRIKWMEQRLMVMSAKKQIVFESIEVGSDAHVDFLAMTTNPEKGMKVIGKGEAACIALAKKYKGILASNNMKDITQYVDAYNIEYITAADIMIKAYGEKYFDENEGNRIWKEMLKKKRILPAETFSEYLMKQRGC